MDPRLLRHYSGELSYLREAGSEFAEQFPKIAARLTMDGMEVADPYVERLLEGFAFLTARVQMKLEAEYPRLIQHLLETVYPNFLAPVPSMMMTQLLPDLADPNLAQGPWVRRGAEIRSNQARGSGTLCEFRTAHDVRLWPVEIASVKAFTYAPDLALSRLREAARIKGGVRIRLRAAGGANFDELAIADLPFHIGAPDEIAYRLHALLVGSCVGTLVTTGDVVAAQWRDERSVSPVGYSEDEALLPPTLRGFSGYRLLQEYAALPQRLLGLRIGELGARLARIKGNECEIVLLLSKPPTEFESLVDATCLSLYCTPAINLFSKRLDRIQITRDSWEHHIVPDRSRPMDFELHSVTAATAYGTGSVGEQPFAPLYATFHGEGGSNDAFYTVRRETRLLSSRQKSHGARSAYVGQEVFLSLVDAREAPYRGDLRQLAVTGLVTNRDLPIFLANAGVAGDSQWKLGASASVAQVRCLRGPTRPQYREPDGAIGWSLVSQLTLNYLSIAGEDPVRSAAILRRVLALYGPVQDSSWAKQIEGIQAVASQRVVRRLPMDGPLTFGTGIEIRVTVDELAFQGGSPYLLGCVLDRLFGRQAALNTFTETVLVSATRGELSRWPVRIGDRALI